MPDVDETPAVPGPAEGAAPPPGNRSRLRVLAFVLVPIIIITFLVLGLIRTTAPKARVGTPAPAFQGLALLDGRTLSSSDLLGRPVVFNFWASWCDPCIAEAPDLEAAYKKYQAQGVQMIGIDYRDTDQDAAAFIKEHGITYPTIRDPNGTLANEFGVTGVPETYFIDSDYRFYANGEGAAVGTTNTAVTGPIKVVGAISPVELKSKIEGVLAIAPRSAPSTPSP